MRLYLGDFAGMIYNDVKQKIMSEFQITLEEATKWTIVIAYMNEDSYEGEACLLLRSRADGQLYSVHSSHCSCYGHEGQFNPEPVTLEYLRTPSFLNEFRL
jgi:hypothetical protein